MDGSVTVSVKSILLAGLVLLGLVTAYLLGGQRRRRARPHRPRPSRRPPPAHGTAAAGPDDRVGRGDARSPTRCRSRCR